MILKPGLYRVEVRYATFGFVVSPTGGIHTAAPMFWKNKQYWISIAKKIGD